MVRVKICGITQREDAQAAIEAGASAIGMIFYEKSPRFLSLNRAADLCAFLPPFVSKVGVFVNETEFTIEKTIRECGLDTIQFHGDEPPGFCQKFPVKSIKAFHLCSESDLPRLMDYDVDGWLLDTPSPQLRGGTGRTFDWSLAVKARHLGRPLILSGGLTPDNVRQAIEKVQPYAVDVSSGVECAPGKKDPRKIRDFLKACVSS